MSKTILIIDDSASIRQSTQSALQDAGYHVIEAIDGQDALKQLNGQKIHLIISAVNMPQMDGITFMQEAKKRPLYQFTPVIMLTTESNQNLPRHYSSTNAKAWLTKPFRPAQMLAAVTKLIMP